MSKLHLLPELPPHPPECCSDIVLGWYSEDSFDFMRWFPGTKKWKSVPNGVNISRPVLAWSRMAIPSVLERSKLKELRKAK